MVSKTEATIEDLYLIEGKAELVNGEIVHMPPAGYIPGYAGDVTFVSLFNYARCTKAGLAVGDNKAFVVDLPNRRSFSPDVAFHTGPRTGMKFLEGAPVCAVEVRSGSENRPRDEERLAAKRADYIATVTLIVWDVDLLSDNVVRAYRADAPITPTVYRRGDTAEAEPAVPGWTMAVDDLFE